MEKKRIHYISLASVISSIAVVMLHANGCFWTFSTERYWITANIIESAMIFAVPIFFMITGATLLDYRDRYTTKKYAAKRIEKTVIPFLAWSLIGVLYLNHIGVMPIEFSLAGVWNIFLNIINVNVLSIYWFFKALFITYICIPLFAAIPKELKVKIFSGFVGIAFVLNSLIPFLCNIFNIGYYNYLTVPVATEYLMYVLLGYILHNVDFTKTARILIYVLSVVGLLMQIIGTYTLSVNAGSIIQTFKGYYNVPCILYSVGVFVFFKQLGAKIKNEKIISILERFSSYTFAIYLLHWFVMNMITRHLNVNTFSMVYRLGAPVAIVSICIILTWLIRKIPVIKKLIP